MHNFYVATLNFKRFNGLKEVNTVFILNFHYFHRSKIFKEIIKNLFLMFLLNGSKTLMIILSFIQVLLC